MTIHPTWLDPRLPQSEPIKGETYRADGWAYMEMMDKPYPVHLFQELELVAGEGNVVYITKLDGRRGRLAMLMVSPESYVKVIAWAQQELDALRTERTLQ